jgi:hypothetical protein
MSPRFTAAPSYRRTADRGFGDLRNAAHGSAQR